MATISTKDSGEKNEMEKQKDNSEFENLQALVNRTDKENPKPEDLAEIKKLLNADSRLVEMNEITALAFERAIKITTSSALMKELFKRQIEEKRRALGYENASQIEQMLIDQVVLCWFRLNNMEMIHASKSYESHNTETGLYWEKRLTGAQRRFTRACETLAKIKKHLSEAELRELQAQNSRKKSTILASKLLKDLTD
jgi:hypothetical protein